MTGTIAAPNKSRGSRSRERILTRATELFAEHGFDAMTMRQLGDAAGLDNSSLYRHFPSKAALIDAVLDHAAAQAFAIVAPLLGRASPLTLQSLEDVCAALGIYLFDHTTTARLIVHWLMSTGRERGGAKVAVPATDRRRPGGKLLAALRAKLADAAKTGRLRKHGQPEALVVLLGIVVLRPATYGHLLKTLEPRRGREAASMAWEAELRATIRGAFAP